MGQFCGMLMLLTPTFRIWQKRAVKVKTLQDNHHFFCNAPFLTSESICQNVRFITRYLFCWCKFFLLACIRNGFSLGLRESQASCTSVMQKLQRLDFDVRFLVVQAEGRFVTGWFTQRSWGHFRIIKKRLKLVKMWWRTKCGDSYSESVDGIIFAPYLGMYNVSKQDGYHH